MRRLAGACAIVATTALLLEAALRLHNPLTTRLRGDTIVLPAGVTYTITNPVDPRLDRVVVQKRNSLGFRGPDVPADFPSRLSIVAVGGSTTECTQLADDKTWPAVMGADLAARFPNVWVNNAGLDGHSTFGHLVLLREQLSRLRPRVAVYLAGVNDVGLGWQGATGPGRTRRWQAVLARSEVAHTAISLLRLWRGMHLRYDVGGIFDVRVALHRPTSAARIEARIASHAAALDAYRARLTAIVTESRQWHIEPVLATQPMLFGDATDPASGVALDTIVEDQSDYTGLSEWRLMERYNDVMREVARANHVDLIDVAHRLPKDSRYFLDSIHFSNAGAAAVGHIVSESLSARAAAVDGV